MRVLLGNLSVRQMQERLGIILNADSISQLEESRQDNAQNIAPDKWHCFDIPFAIVCGSMETATKVFEILKPYSDSMKTKIEICIQ